MCSEISFIKESPATNKPILIIEDDEGLSTLIEKTLKKAGQQVTRVKTGAEAIEKIRNDPNFLLLLDFLLPDMTGNQLIQQLEENRQTVPFILMTGLGDGRTAVQMMKLGARDYLIKDSKTLDMLPEVIRRVNRELCIEAKLTQLEEALRETRQHLHSVINATPIILWSTDKDGLITLSEGRALEQLDLQPGQLVGQSVFDIYATDHKALEAIQRGLEGEEFSIDIEVGGCVWNNHYTPIFDAQNNVVGLIGISIDTTERQQAIEALQESEEKYRHLIENTNDLVYAADAEGIITYIGPQATRYGFAPEEVVSKNMLEFIAPEDHERIIEEFTQTMQTGKVFNSQFRLVEKSGDKFWVEDHANTIIDESGNIAGISGTLRDITDRKKAEDNLRASEAKFRTIFESVSDTIVYVDMSGNIIDTNMKIKDISGYEPEELIGKNFADMDILNADSLQEISRTFGDTLNGAPAQSIQIGINHRNGSKIIAETNPNLLKLSDGTEGILVVIRDITERKQAEEALQENQKKLQTMFDTIADAINLTDLQGTIIDVNQASPRMFGFDTKEAIIGRHASEMIAQQDQVALMEHIEYTLKHGYGGLREYRIIKHTGEEFIGEVQSATIRDVSGEPVAFMSITRDVTEQKQDRQSIENKVKELERYKTITVNRELKMIELKDILKDMEEKLRKAEIEE